MKFIVYNSTPDSGTQHVILRSGDAPEDQISIQAGAGEVAVESPGGWTIPESGTWLYDTSNETIAVKTIPIPPGGPPIGEAGYERLKAEVLEELRRTDWTQLPDAPLTTQEKSDWAAWRAAIRSNINSIGPSSNSGWRINMDYDPPPGPLDEVL